jgi:F-type H+-transporting ATPase subunit b
VNITATLFGQMITFAVLIWFVKAVLWEPMTRMLEERKQRIADGLAAAERGQHEKELAEERAKKLLRQAKQEAAEIIANAQRRANEIVEKGEHDGRAAGERMKAGAQAEIEQETNRAKEELRTQVISLALQGAEKILQKEINAAEHNAFLDKLSRQL